MANHPQNEQLIRRYFDAMAVQDFATVWTCYADDIVYEDAALGHVYRGLAATQEFYLKYMTALSVVNRIETLVTTDSAFGIGWCMSGTHSADLPGLPATGRSFTVRGATMGTIENGRIRTNVDYWNLADLMVQLGVGAQ
jgi:steroid delta-isomerase-like uncharacterized protein